MENSNFSKVLRQLSEGAKKWLLQEFMKDGMPIKIHHKTQSVELDIDFMSLRKNGSHLWVECVETHSSMHIFNVRLNKPTCEVLKHRDPTPEQVKAIYEGVKEFDSVIYGLKTEFDSNQIDFSRMNEELEWIIFSNENSIFQKGKGFALPISWKEEEESNLVKGQKRLSEAFENVKQPITVAEFESITIHPSEIINFFLGWMQSDDLKIVDENLEEIDGAMLHGGNLFGKRFLEFISDAKDTNVPIMKESPEQKGKRIEEDKITQLFNRMQKVEERLNKVEVEKTDYCINEQLLKGEVKLNLPDAGLLVDGKPLEKEQPVKEFEVGGKVVVVSNFFSGHTLKIGGEYPIKRIDLNCVENLPYKIGAWWVSADEIQHAPKEVESGDGEFRIGETYITKDDSIVILCTCNGAIDESFAGVVISSNDNDTPVGTDICGWLKEEFTTYTLPNKGDIV